MTISVFILAGGEGSRLQPLTLFRAKPVVNIGRAALIDFPVRHAMEMKNVNEIFIITQFLQQSIEKYLSYSYGSKIHFLPSSSHNYGGTADSLRKNISLIEGLKSEYILILSGDQIYKSDLHQMVELAENQRADLVIASLLVGEMDAVRFGILDKKSNGLISRFIEKPSKEQLLSLHSSIDAKGKHYLASMGIYLFRKKALVDLLLKEEGKDFGKDLIPKMICHGKSFTSSYDCYWEDIGTIASLHATYMKLACREKKLMECLDFVGGHSLPLTGMGDLAIYHDCIIESDQLIKSAIVGPSKIERKVRMDHTILMGQNRIGQGAVLDRVILDVGATVDPGVHLIGGQFHQKIPSIPGIFLKEGVLIAAQGARIRDSVVSSSIHVA